MACLVLALAVTTWSCAGHVADTSIAPGDLVRITVPSMDMDESVGTVAALEIDTLVVHVGERADALQVPFADVTRLELHRGKKSRVGTGMLIGLAVGAGAGAIVGALTMPEHCLNGDPCPHFGAALGALFLALPGVLAGGIIGAIAKTDRWEDVPLGELRVGPSSVDADGIEVSVTLRL